MLDIKWVIANIIIITMVVAIQGRTSIQNYKSIWFYALSIGILTGLANYIALTTEKSGISLIVLIITIVTIVILFVKFCIKWLTERRKQESIQRKHLATLVLTGLIIILVLCPVYTGVTAMKTNSQKDLNDTPSATLELNDDLGAGPSTNYSSVTSDEKSKSDTNVQDKTEDTYSMPTPTPMPRLTTQHVDEYLQEDTPVDTDYYSKDQGEKYHPGPDSKTAL